MTFGSFEDGGSAVLCPCQYESCMAVCWMLFDIILIVSQHVVAVEEERTPVNLSMFLGAFAFLYS